MINLELKGLEQALAGLEQAQASINTNVVRALDATALDIQRQAKQNAPVDMGPLRSQIGILSPSPYSRRIIAHSKYAAAVEFGSKAHWAPFSAILDWVRRKGIGGRTATGKRSRSKSAQANMERVARAIWISISKRGTRAHPFLFPAYEANKGKLVERLKKALGGMQ